LPISDVYPATGGADVAYDIEAMNSADLIARRLLERMPQLKN